MTKAAFQEVLRLVIILLGIAMGLTSTYKVKSNSPKLIFFVSMTTYQANLPVADRLLNESRPDSPSFFFVLYS